MFKNLANDQKTYIYHTFVKSKTRQLYKMFQEFSKTPVVQISLL